MNCKNIQDELLLNGMKEDMQSHLAECSECREFSKIVEGMNNLNQVDGPSPELDNKVLEYARNNRPQSRQPIPFYILTAVAALLIIGFTVLMTKNTANDSGKETGVAEAIKPQKAIDTPEQKAQTADAMQEELDDALDSLWDDELMNADITAIEGELFVLSAELYSN